MAGKELSSFASSFIFGHLCRFKDCCGSEAIAFQNIIWCCGHKCGQAVWLWHMSWVLTSVLLLNEVYSLEAGRKLWIWKRALPKRESERPESAKDLQVHVLLSFAAILHIFQALGKEKSVLFENVKHKCTGLEVGVESQLEDFFLFIWAFASHE